MPPDSDEAAEQATTVSASHTSALLAAQSSITDQSRLTSGSTQDNLREALLDIGRVEKRLSAGALVKYRVLLDSPEVLQRAKTGASDIELAECAVSAILDFIDNHIAEPRDKLVMQAALATTKEFEGYLVSQRMRALPISEADFKRRRTKQFAELVRYLFGYAPPVTLPPAGQVSLSEEERIYIRYCLYSLAFDAVKLHFACIAGLLEHEISPGSFAGSPGLYNEHIFDCFREFLATSSYWCDQIPPSHRIAAAPEWTEEVDTTLVNHIQKINDLWPLTNPDRHDFLHSTFKMVLKHGGTLRRDDLYYEVWLPWYTENLPEKVDLLVASSGAVTDITLPSLFDYDEIGRAHGDAVDHLAHCYQDRWETTTIDGQTLDDYAKAYIQEKSSDLLKQRYFSIIYKN